MLLKMLLINMTEEENLVGMVLLADTGFARYFFVAIYWSLDMLVIWKLDLENSEWNLFRAQQIINHQNIINMSAGTSKPMKR